MGKTIKIFGVAVLIPILLSFIFFQFSMISYDGILHINKAKPRTVTIERDEFGVPHITSKSVEDAFYGLGFAHAQDRLWNMHLRRLLIRGRLSEIFGPDALDIDKSVRTLGMIRVSEQTLKYIGEDARTNFQAYFEGINDYAHSLKILPFEFHLLGSSWENFTTVDGIALQKFLGFALSFDWSYELLRERLAEVVGREWANEILAFEYDKQFGNRSVILDDSDLKKSGIYKPYNKSEEVLPQGFKDPYKNVDIKDAPPATEPEPNLPFSLYDILIPDFPKGSNCWVLSGNLTVSGKPMLVNDPHLDNNMPCYWYQATLDWGENFIAGISFPGLPTMTMGRTKYFSWGFTAGYADVTDLYNETISKDNKQYLFEGKWYDLEFYEEKINVKGRDQPYILPVYVTRHGPILDLVFAEMHIGRGGPKYTPHNYSLAWSGFVGNDTSFDGIFRLAQSRNTEEILTSLSQFILPPNNVHFATETGDIGWTHMGRIPKRKYPSHGSRIKDGTKGIFEWEGFIPWSEHPKVINPAKGYIASANNKMATDNIINRPSLNMWTTPRADRIEEILEAYKKSNHKITVQDMQKMLLDQVDVYAREIYPIVIKLYERHWDEFKANLSMYKDMKIHQELNVVPWTNPLHPKTKTLNITKLDPKQQAERKTVDIDLVLKAMKGWNGNHSKDSVPAAIYSVWEYFYFMKSLNGIGFNEHERQAFISNIVFEQFIFRKIANWSKESSDANEFWCRSSQSQENVKNLCIYNLMISLYEARDYLADVLGSDVSQWRWGRIHKMEFKNIPFSETPLKFIWHRSYEAGGNTRTINVGSHYIEQHNFDSIHGSNVRFISDLSNKDVVYASLDTGISDRVFSKHYRDQMDNHHAGKFVEMELGSGKKKYASKLIIQ